MTCIACIQFVLTIPIICAYSTFADGLHHAIHIRYGQTEAKCFRGARYEWLQYGCYSHQRSGSALPLDQIDIRLHY